MPKTTEVPAELTFTTKAAPTQRETVTFLVDGEELTSLQPSEGALILLLGRFGEFDALDNDELRHGVAEIVKFLDSILDQRSSARLLDLFRTDRLDIAGLAEVMRSLVEYWESRRQASPAGNRATRRGGAKTGARAAAPRNGAARTAAPRTSTVKAG
jgi:hypothetical protein